jgi:hypothetical protein
MSFNHYARLKRILAAEPAGWYILRIDKPTTATNFKGETKHFDHYYRLVDANNQPIRYGKFQQIERLARALSCDPTDLPILSEESLPETEKPEKIG